MPKVLLLTGPGGAGKSTISDMIARDKGFTYLDGDSEDTEFFQTETNGFLKIRSC